MPHQETHTIYIQQSSNKHLNAHRHTHLKSRASTGYVMSDKSLVVFTSDMVGMLRLNASLIATVLRVVSRNTISRRWRGMPRSEPAGLNLHSTQAGVAVLVLC